MQLSKFIRITEGLKDKGKLLPVAKLQDYISKQGRDYYHSVFYYNQKHFDEFKQKGSIAGIKDVKTDKLVLDFDCKENPDLARQEALQAISKLKSFNINPKDMEIYFSGNKGFNVVITLNKEITPHEASVIALEKIGKGLKTLDPSLYDAPQLIRVPGTRHQVSGLYKIPLTVKELESKTIEQIRTQATSLDNITEEFEWETVTPTPEFYNIPAPPKAEPKVAIPTDLDFTKMPAGWKDYKYAILQGHFDSGERHHALMVLAATCRGLGYDKETAYFLCKSALKKQAARTGTEEFPKEELWENIIEASIYGDSWEGGQYSYKNDPWLKKYCERMGINPEEEIEHAIVTIDKMHEVFTDYAVNFERNIVKTGIKGLDDNVMFLASTHNGILGQPGSGKTSMILQWLKNSSKNGINSVFFSLDMGMPVIFAKLVQEMTGKPFKDAISIFKTDPYEAKKLFERIKTEYGNVGFSFKAGLTVQEIRDIVKKQEDKIGQPVKLLITDYLECLQSQFSDATANAGYISNQMKDIANELQVCSVMLLQTQKHSTSDISDPLLSMKQIKGSSVIEQASSVVLSLWREGYNPKTVNDDRYMSFAAVKNRFGSLWTDDFIWDGVRGTIRDMASEEEYNRLEDFRERKREMKAKEAASKDSTWT